MLIAVASQNRKEITGHTGRCHRFWIYEMVDGKIQQKEFLELSKEQSFHYASVHEAHELDRVDVLICGGLGQGLVQKLARKNITVISTMEKDIEKAIADYLSGSLSQLSPEEHDHDDDHDHDHHHDSNETTFVQLSAGLNAFDADGNAPDKEGNCHHQSGCNHDDHHGEKSHGGSCHH
ncbi:Dinitrogenase iron-molybdenum cofactor biosynthesis protein [Chloroherpeton thalassium ATCC 35110]|uniref:Dinitrogenase iron-molybdenum cofactor biosynthesis protein n=1 Tax=Chloroherpeton thalassium (strain ATCC 35110 / GB-78) TaxID=517418 RepID=B3QSD4_CHLT3|nr:NifB/NifX family molybdenum-iron cluster-binding protein [Chloroherpeton thalassium]ACF12525.1 Dinitrogenase iron-molybdenum cofactor biosynthesis protein [Chloroherpeton thalassium ATCC 35110]